MNLSQYSLVELQKLQVRVEKAIQKKQLAEKLSVHKQVKKLLSKHGLTVDDLVKAKSDSKTRAVRKKTGKVKPKYANPADKKVTWTGRGRSPVWVREHLDKGGKLDDLKIK